MTLYRWVFVALWLTLILYWIILAFSAKRSIGTTWRRRGWRFIVLLIVVVALRTPVLRRALRHAQSYAASSMSFGLIGVLLCALGIGLAIVARAYLGRNWGMPTARKQSPELVTTGPYSFVRHPIYTGLLLAMLGSAIGESVFWVWPLILFGPYFIYSGRREEKLMIEQFPQEYPAYMKRTKMLLPFLV